MESLVLDHTNEAYELEVNVKWYHDSGFALAVNATIQETEITESPDNDGNEAPIFIIVLFLVAY